MPRLEVRLTDDQMLRLRRDAEAAGMDLSNWVRFCCLRKEPQTTGNPQKVELRGKPSAGTRTEAHGLTRADSVTAEPSKREQREARGLCGECGSMGHTTEEHGKW